MVGRSFCEEFCSHIYEDKINQSFLVNVDHEWFVTLNKGLERLNYKLVHFTEMPKSLTCVFVKA